MRRVVLVLALTCCLLASCQLLATPTAAPSEPVLATRVEQVVGVWHSRRHVIQFNRDGTYGVDEADPQPCSSCGVEGRFWFEDTHFVVEDSGGSQACFARQIGRYEVTVAARGYLIFEPLSEDCPGREEILQRSIWLWGPPET